MDGSNQRLSQVDLDVSFTTAGLVQEVAEVLLAGLWRGVLGMAIPRPFPRISYREEAEHYGSGEPDLRLGLPIETFTDALAESSYQVSYGATRCGGAATALRVSGAAAWSDKGVNALTSVAFDDDAKGLVWLKVCDDEW